MSDLGTDSSNAGLNLGSKVVEGLIRLLSKILDAIKEHIENSPNRKRAKIELAKLKDEKKKLALVKKIEGIHGEVKLKELEKYARMSGDSVIKPIGVAFSSKEDVKMFAEMAKREGLTWHGLKNKNEELGKGFVQICVCGKDVGTLKNIIERMEDIKRIKVLDNKIDEIRGKYTDVNKISDYDKMLISNLEKEKERIKDKYADKFNDMNFEKAVNDVLSDYEISHGEKEEIVKEKYKSYSDKMDKESTLAVCLDSFTDGKIDGEKECVIVDAGNPNNYIVCRTNNDTYNNEDYKKTTFEVHNESGEVKNFDDGRFDGRPKGYWKDTKEQMLVASGFKQDATLHKFTSLDEFKLWQVRTIRENQKDNLRGDYTKDVDKAIADRKKSLAEMGYEIKNGEAVNISLNKPAIELHFEWEKLEGAVLNNPKNKLLLLNNLEAIQTVLAINKLEELKQLNTEKSIADSELLTANTAEEISEAKEKVENIDKAIEVKKEEIDTTHEMILELNGQENSVRGQIHALDKVMENNNNEIVMDGQKFERDWDAKEFDADEKAIYGEDAEVENKELADDEKADDNMERYREKIQEERENNKESGISHGEKEHAKSSKSKGMELD